MRKIYYGNLLRNANAPICLQTDTVVNNSLHEHDFFEFVYVVHGKVEHIREHKSAIIGAGDYFLINLKDAHGYRRIDGCKIINILFLPEFIDESLRGADSFQKILDDFLIKFGYRHFVEAPTLRIFHDDTGFVGALCNNMLLEYEQKKDGYIEILRNLLLTVIIYLVRSEMPDAGSGTSRHVKFIKDYVMENYAKPLRLSDIAEELNFSLQYLSMLFRREVGMTFRDYLIRVRIEKSLLYLRSTEKTVAEIATLVGYSDPAFFYKAFKTQLNVTPDEYRANSK